MADPELNCDSKKEVLSTSPKATSNLEKSVGVSCNGTQSYSFTKSICVKELTYSSNCIHSADQDTYEQYINCDKTDCSVKDHVVAANDNESDTDINKSIGTTISQCVAAQDPLITDSTIQDKSLDDSEPNEDICQNSADDEVTRTCISNDNETKNSENSVKVHSESERAISRQQTEEGHLDMCRQEDDIECDFSHIGCEEKYSKQNQQKHMNQNATKHLALMSQAMMKMSLDYGKRLQQSERRVTALEQSLLEKEEDIFKLKVAGGVYPIELKVENYERMRHEKKKWNSMNLYSHTNGHKFQLMLQLNESQTHLSVYIVPKKSMHDNYIKWPLKVTLSLHLLNQYRDRDHLGLCKWCQWKKDGAVFLLREKFVECSDLEWNSETKTQFLKNDSLRLRIDLCKIH